MGVLLCDRNNCQNIMCDTYVEEIDCYICDDCKEEFKNYLIFKKQDPNALTSNQIIENLKLFMHTAKSSYLADKISVNKFFNDRNRT